MKLLIVTQKIDKNDGYFGFFHGWLLEFAKQCESVTVIGLEVGAYDLPKNVKVYSLGKESGKSRLKYIWRLWKYSWRERKNYSAVLAHMSPLYVIFGFPVWKMTGKKIGMWYVHRNVDTKLRIATALADVVFSAVPESFRIKTPKVNFMGQAVPIDLYARPREFAPEKSKAFKIISVGRITPIKNLDTLAQAVAILRDQNILVDVDLIGEPVVPADIECKKKLVDIIAEKNVGDRIHFVGNVPNKNIPPLYWQSDLSVNLCPTGGLDKVVLESMAAGTPTIVSNKAFEKHFGQYKDRLIFAERNPEDCAKKIKAFIESSDQKAVAAYLQNVVKEKSSLESLIRHIISLLQ